VIGDPADVETLVQSEYQQHRLFLQESKRASSKQTAGFNSASAVVATSRKVTGMPTGST